MHNTKLFVIIGLFVSIFTINTPASAQYQYGMCRALNGMLVRCPPPRYRRPPLLGSMVGAILQPVRPAYYGAPVYTTPLDQPVYQGYAASPSGYQQGNYAPQAYPARGAAAPRVVRQVRQEHRPDGIAVHRCMYDGPGALTPGPDGFNANCDD
jgi:hypothetical protein